MGTPDHYFARGGGEQKTENLALTLAKVIRNSEAMLIARASEPPSCNLHDEFFICVILCNLALHHELQNTVPSQTTHLAKCRFSGSILLGTMFRNHFRLSPAT